MTRRARAWDDKGGGVTTPHHAHAVVRIGEAVGSAATRASGLTVGRRAPVAFSPARSDLAAEPRAIARRRVAEATAGHGAPWPVGGRVR